MQLERGLVDPHGLPGRPEFKYIYNNSVYLLVIIS